MAGGSFSKVHAPVTTVHSNLDQEIIQITEDRLRLVLKDHLSDAEERKTWIAPLGILIAIVTAFVTANFKDYYLKAPTWEAVFLLSGIASFVWLILSVRKASRAPTVDDIVEKIKKRSERLP